MASAALARAVDDRRRRIANEIDEHAEAESIRALAHACGTQRPETGTLNAIRAVLDRPPLSGGPGSGRFANDKSSFGHHSVSKASFRTWKNRLEAVQLNEIDSSQLDSALGGVGFLGMVAAAPTPHQQGRALMARSAARPDSTSEVALVMMATLSVTEIPERFETGIAEVLPPAVPQPPMSASQANDLFEMFLDGEVDANDPQMRRLPAHMRAQAERIAAAETEHKEKASLFVAKREHVLKTLGNQFTGKVQMPCGSSPRVLAIHGMGMSDEQWYYNHLFGKSTAGCRMAQSEEDQSEAAAAWLGVRVDDLSFGWAEDVALVGACQGAIVSGRYDGIVLCDLSLRDLMEEPERLFEQLIGSHLQAFASAGGRVAFPTSDGMLMANMGVLNRTFGVNWEVCSYTKEYWGPLSAASTAPYAAPASLKVIYTKASTLKKVPVNERVCGAVANSQTYEIGPDGDFEDQAAFDSFAERCGYSAAAHKYGRGCIAYFGDTNCSLQTPLNVSNFCQSGLKRQEERPRRFRLNFDGACQPNPGRGGAGGLLLDSSGGTASETPISIPLGDCTSNVAE